MIRERDILRRIHASGAQFIGEVPRALAWGEEAGRVLLTTNVMEGTPLSRAALRRLRWAMSEGVDWLLKFNRAIGGERVEDNAGWERHILSNVKAYRRNYMVSEEAGRVLEERFGPSPGLSPEVKYTRRERGVRVPLVLRHGDFNTANVLSADGGVQVIDWELWNGPDAAGADLVYWLQSCQPGKAREAEQRFRCAFFTPGESAEAARRYFDALGVAPELRWPLFLLG